MGTETLDSLDKVEYIYWLRDYTYTESYGINTGKKKKTEQLFD